MSSHEEFVKSVSLILETSKALKAISEGYSYRFDDDFLDEEGVIYVIVENPTADHPEHPPYLVFTAGPVKA